MREIEVHIDINPLDFILGMYAGMILLCFIIVYEKKHANTLDKKSDHKKRETPE